MIDNLLNGQFTNSILPELSSAHGLIEDGGSVVVMLLAMSTLVIALTLLKLWQFQRLRIFKKQTTKLALQYYRSGDARGALAILGKCPNPNSQLLKLGIQARTNNLDEQAVKEELACYGQETLAHLRGKLRILEVIAAIAPLLGLFGTVLGMIEAFQQLQSAGNQVNPAMLSGGIWVALLTTACGLAVAMPTVIVVNWLERQLEHLANDMSLTANRLFTPDLSQPMVKANMPNPL